MAQSDGFFSDPKVLVALLALVVSVTSLVWTLANQFEQNRRWDALNAAAIELNESRLFVWRELTRAEAEKTEWGYEPLIFGSEPFNKFRLVHFLQLRDPASGQPIPNANPVFTFKEVEAEIKRLGVKPPVAVFRAFRPSFTLENVGKTEAKDAVFRLMSAPTKRMAPGVFIE